MSVPVPGLHVPGDPQPESRFIAPDDRCPNPGYWHSTDGDSTELEVGELVAAFVRALQPELVVETGAAFGSTTEMLALALKRNGHGHLVALECDELRADAVEYRLALRSYAPALISVVRASSLNWTPPLLNLPPIGLLFSDSNYECRVPEFLHLRQWMKPGSIVVFHDTAPERGSHRIAGGRDLRTDVELELGAFLRYVHLPTPRGVTIAEVL